MKVYRTWTKEYRTWAGWRRAIKRMYPAVTIDGDKDIACAIVDGRGVGEWDGEKGCIFYVTV